MPKAVIIEPGYLHHSVEQQVLAPLCVSIERLNWKADRQLLRRGLDDADVVFVRDTVLASDDIAAMNLAKGIVRYGIGVDTIDLAAAKAKGIKVANVLEYGADIEVADHTLALFLAVKRRIVSHDKAVRAGAWQIGQSEPIQRIAGSTLGIVGFGRIGRAVRKRFEGFGVEKVLVHDPFITNEQAENCGVHLVELSELASEADIITLHAPVISENRHCIGEDFITRMKAGAIIINTARGPLVDEIQLYTALKANKILGAGLDVFVHEPPSGNRLLELDNVVVSDHAAWYSETTVRAIQACAAQQAYQILSGSNPTNWVNP